MDAMLIDEAEFQQYKIARQAIRDHEEEIFQRQMEHQRIQDEKIRNENAWGYVREKMTITPDLVAILNKLGPIAERDPEAAKPLLKTMTKRQYRDMKKSFVLYNYAYTNRLSKKSVTHIGGWMVFIGVVIVVLVIKSIIM